MKYENFNKFMLFTIITISFTAYSCAAKYSPDYSPSIGIKAIIKPGDTVKVTR